MWTANIHAHIHDGRSPTAGFHRRVSERGHERCPREHAPHHFALDSDAAPVDDPQSPKAQAMRFGEILFDHRFYVPRREGVEIQNVGDLKLKKPGVAAGLVNLDFFLFFAHPTISLPRAADCNRSPFVPSGPSGEV